MNFAPPTHPPNQQNNRPGACCLSLPLPRPQKKKVKEVSHEWQLVNKQKPIWMRK